MLHKVLLNLVEFVLARKHFIHTERSLVLREGHEIPGADGYQSYQTQ